MSLLDITVKVRDLLKDLSLEEKKKILNDVYSDFKIELPKNDQEKSKKDEGNNKNFHELCEEKKPKTWADKLLIAMVALSFKNDNKPVGKKEIEKYFDDEVETFPSTFGREVLPLIKERLILSKGNGKSTKYQVTSAGKKKFQSMGFGGSYE